MLNPEKLYKIKDRRQGEILPTDSGLKDNQHIETTARNKKKIFIFQLPDSFIRLILRLHAFFFYIDSKS